jgi:hypothetical protein
MKTCVVAHARPKTALPVLVAKIWVANGWHEIVVRRRKHVSREAKNSLTGLRGPKRVILFGDSNNILLWFRHQNLLVLVFRVRVSGVGLLIRVYGLGFGFQD